MIEATGSKLHWNYFIALERDLEVVSRYVEFCPDNFDVYSIEFAHLLFAAASEVDVIAKLLCERLQPEAPHGNINNYRAVLTATIPELPASEILVPRYGLSLNPWDNWSGPDHPLWWHSYNKVKHRRDTHFREATLKNSLNALAGLLVLICHHYRWQLAPDGSPPLSPRATTRELQPESTLLRFPSNYYFVRALINI